MSGWRWPAAIAAVATALLAASAPAQLPDSRFGDRPSATDPEAHDAVDLFSRLCVTTRGDRRSAADILGGGDGSVQKLDDRTVSEMQGGKAGGIGWTVRMPLGEKLIVEFAPSGTCIVRAPRVAGPSLERGLEAFLDQVGASGRFQVRRIGDDEKTIDKRKYHFVTWGMRLPDTGRTVEIGVATTDAKDAFIQGTLTFAVMTTTPK